MSRLRLQPHRQYLRRLPGMWYAGSINAANREDARMHVIVKCPVVGLLVAISLAWLTGCERKAAPQQAADSVRTARSLLEFAVQEAESHPRDGPARDNAIKSMRTAIDQLTGVSAQSLPEPLLVVAEITGSPPESGSMFLKLRYVDPRAQVNQIYLLDSAGVPMIYDTIWKRSARLRKWLGENALIEIPFAVAVDDKSEIATNKIPHTGPMLRLDVNELEKGMKVGFITVSGKKTPPVNICFAPNEPTGWITYYPDTQPAATTLPSSEPGAP
jgi:hypothetical protein